MPLRMTMSDKMKNLALYLLAAIAAVGLAVAPWMILGAPEEETMGLVQKIFYFHVPSAIVDFLAIYVCGIASVVFLVTRSKWADGWAVVAAELAVLLGAITLVTGSLWARKAWGVWWTWDARLTTFSIVEMVFVAYLLVRAYGGPGSSTLAAALALFGCIDVPIIYKSVSLWRTLHPKAEVVRKLIPEMRVVYNLSFLTLFALFALLFWLRLRIERNRLLLDELHIAASEAGLEDS